jgi:hypothetical protein
MARSDMVRRRPETAKSSEFFTAPDQLRNTSLTLRVAQHPVHTT